MQGRNFLHRRRAIPAVGVVREQAPRDRRMMSLDMFNSLLETVHLLKSPANAARLERSIAQYRAGKAVERDLIDD